jgi:arylsulfatase A-like enzyme
LDDRIDGVDLLPYVTGVKTGQIHNALYWRWAGQYATRSGDWKYLKAGNREYLFDIASPNHEYENLLDHQPAIAQRLKRQLIAWSEELYEPGFDHPVGYRGDAYYDFYLDGKPAPLPKAMISE